MRTRLVVVPISLKEANAFVVEHHRHHGEARGCLFCVAVARADSIVGVAIVGRPVSRMLDDGFTAEVVRNCTDGTEHAASKLYGAAWRVAQQLGYRRMLTYVLDTESGASVRAAGWRFYGPAGGGSWSRKGRPRVDTHPLQGKLRFEVGGE